MAMLPLLVLLSCSWAAAGAHTGHALDTSEDACLAGEVCQGQDDASTSMVQVSLQLDARGASHKKKPVDRDLNAEQGIGEARGKKGSAKWEGQVATNGSHCLDFETSTASDGLPVPIEAALFGVISQLSLPIGAGCGIFFHPISTGVTARWMALGAGALVFAVATQIYGNSLFALLAVSRKYGPFDDGCKVIHGISVCDEKFYNMIVQCLAGLVGAYVYCSLDKKLQHWSEGDNDDSDAGSDAGSQSTKTVSRYAPSQNQSGGGDGSSHSSDDSDPKSGTDVDKDPDSPKSKKKASRHQQRMLKQKTPDADAAGANVALSMWLGCLLDSVPSAVMIGLLTNRHQVSFGFLFALFLSSFPTAFSGASILMQNEMPPTKIMLLWTGLLITTGVFALLTSFFCPETCSGETFSVSSLYGTSFAEGFTGGLLLACLATALMPAAYQGAKHSAGIYFVFGFMIAILFETLNSYVAGPQQMLHGGKNHKLLWGFGR